MIKEICVAQGDKKFICRFRDSSYIVWYVFYLFHLFFDIQTIYLLHQDNAFTAASFHGYIQTTRIGNFEGRPLKTHFQRNSSGPYIQIIISRKACEEWARLWNHQIKDESMLLTIVLKSHFTQICYLLPVLWECITFMQINPRLTKGGWLPTPREFFSGPQNQRLSDQGHLGNLHYILCGHFDGTKWEYPLQVG